VTRWRIATLSIEADLWIVLDSDDPETIAKVEHSMTANGFAFERVEEEGFDMNDPGDRADAYAQLDDEEAAAIEAVHDHVR